MLQADLEKRTTVFRLCVYMFIHCSVVEGNNTFYTSYLTTYELSSFICYKKHEIVSSGSLIIAPVRRISHCSSMLCCGLYRFDSRG